MKEIISTITSKGQVTIPREVRHHLGLQKGDKLSFVLEDDGSVAVHVPTYPTVAALAGAAGSLPESKSWREMREIAREDAVEDEYHNSR